MKSAEISNDPACLSSCLPVWRGTKIITERKSVAAKAASNGTAIDGKKGDVRDGRTFLGWRNFEEARKSAAVGKIGCEKGTNG